MAALRPVFLCDSVRTPFGRYGGALAGIRTDDLATLPLQALLARNPSLQADAIDEVILGCANQAGEDNRNVARMAALLAGLPVTVPGVTVNRLCASGMEAIGYAARGIAVGELELCLAGGVESMSRSPYVIGKAETAFGRGQQMEDTTLGWRLVNPKMRERYGVDSLSQTAENVAREYHISRADQDAFALRSQQRTAAAQSSGTLAKEIIPVEIAGPKGQKTQVTVDEHPRPSTTLADLARLKGVVSPEGTVTAGNASGINDGAAAAIVASEAAVKRHGLTPRARILGSATSGVAPRVMGIGPVAAVRRLLERMGVKLSDIGVVETNEAFAAQVLAVLRELGIPDDAAHVNRHGGAIALGHPLGASGARLAGSAMYQMHLYDSRYALCCMCVGVGQGMAMLMEKV